MIKSVENTHPHHQPPRIVDGTLRRIAHGVSGTKFLLAITVILIAAIGMFSGHMTGAEFGVVADAALLFYSGANWLTTRDTVKTEPPA